MRKTRCDDVSGHRSLPSSVQVLEIVTVSFNVGYVEGHEKTVRCRRRDTPAAHATQAAGSQNAADGCTIVDPQVNHPRRRHSEVLRANILGARSKSFFFFFCFMTYGKCLLLFIEIAVLPSQCRHRIFHSVF